MSGALREKCPYSGFFWSVFSRIWTEYGEILRISAYSVRMRQNADQKNSKYGHFSRSGGGGKRRVKDPVNHLCWNVLQNANS